MDIPYLKQSLDFPSNNEFLSRKEPACQCRRCWFSPLVWEDPTCRAVIKLVSYNCQACALEPKKHNYWSPACPRAGAQQREKPLQRGDCATQLEKSPQSNKTQHSWKLRRSINKIIKQSLVYWVLTLMSQ